MIEASGGLANFIAILIPALMGGFYGYRCLFLSDGFIDQYGLGAGSEFMVKLSGTYINKGNLKSGLCEHMGNTVTHCSCTYYAYIFYVHCC